MCARFLAWPGSPSCPSPTTRSPGHAATIVLQLRSRRLPNSLLKKSFAASERIRLPRPMRTAVPYGMACDGLNMAVVESPQPRLFNGLVRMKAASEQGPPFPRKSFRKTRIFVQSTALVAPTRPRPDFVFGYNCRSGLLPSATTNYFLRIIKMREYFLQRGAIVRRLPQSVSAAGKAL